MSKVVEAITAQTAAMLQARYGADVRWSFDTERGYPLTCIAAGKPIPILIGREKAEAIFRFGNIVDIKTNNGSTKEDSKASFLFGQNEARKYRDDNLESILKKASEAKKNNYESFSLDTGLEFKAAEELCSILAGENGFPGAKIRRGKVIVALDAKALVEKPKSIHDRERARKGKEVKARKPEKVLTGMACNYISEAFGYISRLGEKARSEGKKEFKFNPDVDREVLPYLAKELKKQGFKDAKAKGKSVLVTLKDNNLNDIFNSVEPQ